MFDTAQDISTHSTAEGHKLRAEDGVLQSDDEISVDQTVTRQLHQLRL